MKKIVFKKNTFLKIIYFYLFIWLCRILAAASELLVEECGIQFSDRDWTQALLIGSTES